MPVQIRPEELIKLLRSEFLAITASQYQTGTWTATFTPATSGTVTLNASYQTGAYTRVGRLVTVTGYFEVLSVASPVGILIIGGLPFACANGLEFSAAASIRPAGLAAGAITTVIGAVIPNTSTLYAYTYAAGAAGVLADYLQASSQIVLSATYFTT